MLATLIDAYLANGDAANALETLRSMPRKSPRANDAAVTLMRW